jgi:hypothetical protein
MFFQQIKKNGKEGLSLEIDAGYPQQPNCIFCGQVIKGKFDWFAVKDGPEGCGHVECWTERESKPETVLSTTVFERVTRFIRDTLLNVETVSNKGSEFTLTFRGRAPFAFNVYVGDIRDQTPNRLWLSDNKQINLWSFSASLMQIAAYILGLINSRDALTPLASSALVKYEANSFYQRLDYTEEELAYLENAGMVAIINGSIELTPFMPR